MLSSDDGTVCISFETHYDTNTRGKCLAVCGSLDVLGNWDVKQAVMAGKVTIKLTIELPFQMHRCPILNYV